MNFKRVNSAVFIVLCLALIFSIEVFLQREFKIPSAGKFYGQIMNIASKEDQVEIFYQLLAENLANMENVNDWDLSDKVSLEEVKVYDEIIVSLYLERKGVRKLVWCIEKRRLKPGSVKVLAEEAAILLAFYLSEKNQPEVDRAERPIESSHKKIQL